MSQREIVEEGVTSIELMASSTINRTFRPTNRRVKWFIDELDQRWVKFRTYPISTRRATDHVWPADKVVEVQYVKSHN